MKRRQNKNKISRRGFLSDISKTAFMAASVSCVSLLERPLCARQADAPKRPQSFGKAKAVIQLWLWGGPSHLYTFDPKPDAGYDYCGPLANPISTNVDGIRIGQLLPNLAKCADKYSILRSVSHGQNAHETAAYLTQTGRMPGRYVYPCAGAVVSKFKGYDAGYSKMIPPYIVMTSPQGRFSESGFLGTKYKPFATGGDPSRVPFEVEGIVARGIPRSRQEIRKEILKSTDTFSAAMSSSGYLKQSDEAVEQAYNLVLGDAGQVFDISKEPESIRQEYGRDRFANSCLIARRLVEYGVPYITINYGGWDTHKGHFEAMGRMLPSTDRAVAALINDLHRRGLLDSTIVWMTGEFGRTPKIDWAPPYCGGRGHWGNAFSQLIAGGGFKGGVVVGKTDDKGAEVAERPISPGDVIGSIYSNLGIDPDATLTTPQADVVRIVPDKPEEGIVSGGLLAEIM